MTIEELIKQQEAVQQAARQRFEAAQAAIAQAQQEISAAQLEYARAEGALSALRQLASEVAI